MKNEFIYYPKYTNVQSMVYNIPDISRILGISMRSTYRLLDKNQFPVIRAVRKKLIPIKTFHLWVEQNHPEVELPEYYELPKFLQDNKKSYSVPEVRAMLGMNKTSSYEMIKVSTFETVIVNNHIRIMKDSFDAWFHAQDYLIDKEDIING
ncbi:hypothetical protein [Chakrabartyella piscis]|uniref:helix-turn-helix domain-containing protein n=1 Tax=Chakrabartyella piscis TaxID=2918914 RepID=UPI0029588998|nr:hypothetical protein [Chakrabartyella piscis]